MEEKKVFAEEKLLINLGENWRGRQDKFNPLSSKRKKGVKPSVGVYAKKNGERNLKSTVQLLMNSYRWNYHKFIVQRRVEELHSFEKYVNHWRSLNGEKLGSWLKNFLPTAPLEAIRGTQLVKSVIRSHKGSFLILFLRTLEEANEWGNLKPKAQERNSILSCS